MSDFSLSYRYGEPATQPEDSSNYVHAFMYELTACTCLKDKHLERHVIVLCCYSGGKCTKYETCALLLLRRKYTKYATCANLHRFHTLYMCLL